MSTARLPGLGLHESPGAHDPGRPARTRQARAPSALAAGLLALCLYAAFAHGSVSPTDTERVQLATAVLVAIAAAAWLWGATVTIRAPALAWAGLGLFGLFAVWCGATLLWSVSPDQTWAECNRALTYALVLGLAITLGASLRRAVELVAGGFLVVCLAVTAYGLGQKLLPGLHFAGLLQLDQTGQLSRLQEPFGYWNALALFVVFGVPVALSLAVDQQLPEPIRIVAAGAIVAMLVTLAFTYSRGGVLALVAALAASIGLSGTRLRSLMWLALACLAALAPVVLGLTNYPLTAASVGLGTRELAGAELAVVLAASLLLLAIAARRVIARERRVVVSEHQARQVRRGLAGLAAAVAVAALLAVGFSGRGLDGTVSHAWHSFTATRSTGVYDPGRLLSADSENRWVWWQEAARAFAARPVSGWGAGSFGVVHLLYRHNALSVQQPHSVPLQFLAETGVVGALLGLGAFALLVASAVRVVRRRPSGSPRPLAAALLAGSVAYAVHACYEWDWDIPGVTLPALIFLGVLAGSAGPRPSGGSLPRARDGVSLRRRAVGLALSTVCLGAFAWSVVVPRLAAAHAAQALVAASESGPSGLGPALAEALQAARLDPLSDAGLTAAATIELHLGHRERSRHYLLAAVDRQPTDGEAWQRLGVEDFFLGDDRDALIAVQRALALDPHGATAIALAQRAQLVARRAAAGVASGPAAAG